MNLCIRVLAAALLGCAGSLVFVTSTAHAAAETAVITGNRANLRAAPAANSEVVGTLTKGQPVTVLEQIQVRDPQPDEPPSWAKIRFPASVKVWVFAAFVDPKSGAVTTRELKIRSGAGKNYAAVGELGQGDLVVPIRTVEGWMQIEPPAEAIAYVAGNLLQPTSSAAVVRPPTPGSSTQQPDRVALSQPVIPGNSAPPREAPRTEVLVPDAVATPPTVTRPVPEVPTTIDPPPAVVNAPPVVAIPPADVPAVPKTTIPSPVAETPAAVTTIPPTSTAPVEISTSVQYRQPVLVYDENRPRHVLREGVVGLSISPDAPGWYQLESFRRGEGLIDYLIVDDPKKTELSKWRGKRVFIEGDEYRDRRWLTPVLKITSVQAAL